jgi:hypothetical protein
MGRILYGHGAYQGHSDAKRRRRISIIEGTPARGERCDQDQEQ